MTTTRDELRKLAENASQGPWDAHDGYVSANEGRDGIAGNCMDGDAEFIAAARTSLPALLDQLDAAEARIQAVRHLHRRDTIYDHVDGCPDTSDAHADAFHEEDVDHRDEYYCTLRPIQDVCFECSDEDSGGLATWPCPTIRALEA